VTTADGDHDDTSCPPDDGLVDRVAVVVGALPTET
jgi:hypothetical protein